MKERKKKTAVWKCILAPLYIWKQKPWNNHLWAFFISLEFLPSWPLSHCTRGHYRRESFGAVIHFLALQKSRNRNENVMEKESANNFLRLWVFPSCFNSSSDLKSIFSRRNTNGGNKQREKGKNLEVYFTDLSSFPHRRVINTEKGMSWNRYFQNLRNHPAVGLVAVAEAAVQIPISKAHFWSSWSP